MLERYDLRQFERCWHSDARLQNMIYRGTKYRNSGIPTDASVPIIVFVFLIHALLLMSERIPTQSGSKDVF